MNGETEEYVPHVPLTSQPCTNEDHFTKKTDQEIITGNNCYRLEDLAYTRSGDKGNHSNIGL